MHDLHLDQDGPKVWLDGAVQHLVLDEPKWQTIDHLQAVKTPQDRSSYAGSYAAVWITCATDSSPRRSSDSPEPDRPQQPWTTSGFGVGRTAYSYFADYTVEEALPDDLFYLFQDAGTGDTHARLDLSFRSARYVPDTHTTAVDLDLSLSYHAGHRWPSTPPVHVERTARVCCSHTGTDTDTHTHPTSGPSLASPGAVSSRGAADGNVVWTEPHWFGGSSTVTRLGFTLLTDSSPLRRPFLYLEWRCGPVCALMLFKKLTGGETEAKLTSDERARLGIGKKYIEVEVAHTLSVLSQKWVAFSPGDRSQTVANNRSA